MTEESNHFSFENLFIFWIQHFIEKGYIFLIIYEMKITIINNKRYMTYQNYLTQPKKNTELNLIMIIYGNPHLKKALDESVNPSLFKKTSHIPLDV